MPTVAGGADLTGITKACGFPHKASVDNFGDLDEERRDSWYEEVGLVSGEDILGKTIPCINVKQEIRDRDD